MRRTSPGLLAAVLALTALLTACGSGTKSTSTGTTQVTIAGSDHLGGAPVHTATENNQWAANHLTPKLQSFTTGRDALNAVLGGQAQYAVVGDLPAVSAILADRKIKILAALSGFTDWRLLTATSSGITSFADLKGRKIGLPEGTNVQYALSGMLTRAGLKPADVTLVNLAPNQVTASLARGDIDAGLTFPSFYDATKATLGSKYRELRYGGYTYRTLLITAAGTSTATSTAVLRTLITATKTMAQDPAAARKEVVSQAEGAVQPGFVNRHYTSYAYEVALDEPLLKLLLAEGAWAKSAQKLSGTPDRATFLQHIDREPLTAAASTAVTLH
ncbi:ABC transporter substrate-binding protein [Streptomyces cyaneochromogenes]|uniref:ABC transporter substrate-binding protein n=1 Tax=Streptomyces cyaneochromogenes TaxID=2496836 RepID=A0A3Q9EYR9_9ACTN|nr:ABC transporter substrate-binding protein [Streptomyces cyaneochromogenes]AZQ39270.1 ABC transporter substrate-binding protein [Streptomyces cyaneochromogenes]